MRRLRGNILQLFALVYPVPEEGTCGNWGGVLSVIFWELARITGWSEYEMLGFSKCSSRFEIRVRNVVWILSSIYFNIYQILFWVTWLEDCPPQNRLRKDKARTRKIERRYSIVKGYQGYSKRSDSNLRALAIKADAAQQYALQI